MSVSSGINAVSNIHARSVGDGYHPGMPTERPYVPATGHDALLPFYDPLMKLLGAQRMLHALVAQAELQPRHVVLDIGCGTGTLAILVKQARPDAEVMAVDPDPPALARAARKAQRAGVSVQFECGFAEALPYPDGTFDRVFSSMMFHHVGQNEKSKVLAEVRRVLKPGGRLEFMDFAGGTHNFLAQVLHGRQVNASAEDRLLRRMREAGMIAAHRTDSQRTFLGAIASYQATAP
jgi:ubiquinone/menaquinone biosynthesis C-methylase UbiE